ncbi:MAG: retroviral-like aspartic protease family protein [Acetobacter sp.]
MRMAGGGRFPTCSGQWGRGYFAWLRTAWRRGGGSRSGPATGVAMGLALAVAAGASAAAPARAEPGCPQLIARVSLYDDAGFLTVAARINSHNARMIVDTGSEGSLLSPEAAALFDTRPDPTTHTVVQGTGGMGRIVPNVIVRSLTVGGLEFGPVSVPVSGLPAVPLTDPAVEGLIGGDMLSRYDIELNVAEGWMAFWSARGAGCSGPVGWRYIYRAVSLQTTGRQRVIAQVELDGWPLRALVDSGARSRIVAERTALRMGVTPQALAQDPGGVTAGVDGHEQPYRWHRFNLLQIGQEQEHAPVLTVAPLHDTVDMLLGSDWFATHRVWISYSTGTLYVMPSARRKD